jgi:hypothetical protein
VREEVEAASLVATRLLTRVTWISGKAGSPGMTELLARLGRVRANEIELLDQDGAAINILICRVRVSGRGLGSSPNVTGPIVGWVLVVAAVARMRSAWQCWWVPQWPRLVPNAERSKSSPRSDDGAIVCMLACR